MSKRSLMFMVFMSLTSFAQNDDLAYQMRLIQVLLPEATRFGLIYNKENPAVEADLNIAINQTGLRVFKYPITSVRELTKGVRTLISRYEVDFIYVVNDNMITSRSALKILANQTKRRGIPLFTLSDNVINAGGYAQLFKDKDQWRMRIVGQTTGKYAISIPPNDTRFIIE